MSYIKHNIIQNITAIAIWYLQVKSHHMADIFFIASKHLWM